MTTTRLFSLNSWLAFPLLGLSLFLGAVLPLLPAQAHQMLVFAYSEGDTIHTESKFAPDTPVPQGEVQVLERETGKVLLTGQTDDQGKFSFKIPAEAAAQKMDLEIVVEGGMGHQGTWLLRADSYLPEAKTAAPAPAASSPLVSDPQAVSQEALDQALERHLAPIKKELAELTIHRTSLPDIIGGIGYIIGIFGLWAYFQARRKKNP
ncbi:MAG: hypothetical protein ACLFUU_05545 [Desulfobacteraceae bacterium]